MRNGAYLYLGRLSSEKMRHSMIKSWRGDKKLNIDESKLSALIPREQWNNRKKKKRKI